MSKIKDDWLIDWLVDYFFHFSFPFFFKIRFLIFAFFLLYFFFFILSSFISFFLSFFVFCCFLFCFCFFVLFCFNFSFLSVSHESTFYLLYCNQDYFQVVFVCPIIHCRTCPHTSNSQLKGRTVVSQNCHQICIEVWTLQPDQLRTRPEPKLGH